LDGWQTFSRNFAEKGCRSRFLGSSANMGILLLSDALSSKCRVPCSTPMLLVSFSPSGERPLTFMAMSPANLPRKRSVAPVMENGCCSKPTTRVEHVGQCPSTSPHVYLPRFGRNPSTDGILFMSLTQISAIAEVVRSSPLTYCGGPIKGGLSF